MARWKPTIEPMTGHAAEMADAEATIERLQRQCDQLSELVDVERAETQRLTRERDECRKLLREACELHRDFGANGQAYFLGDDWLKAARAAGGE